MVLKTEYLIYNKESNQDFTKGESYFCQEHPWKKNHMIAADKNGFGTVCHINSFTSKADIRKEKLNNILR